MLLQKNRVKFTILLLLACVALVSGLLWSYYLHQDKQIDASRFHGTLLSQPRDIQFFELLGIDAQPFNNERLNGQWTMMFFGFTSCGYLCPTTMAELGKMARLLQERGVRSLPQVVMISIDPKRDDLNRLAHYVHTFHPEFYGARGDKSAIKRMTRELGIAYAKVALKPEHGAETYDIEHTGTVLLFNPKGQLTAFFTGPHQASHLADDYLLLTS